MAAVDWKAAAERGTAGGRPLELATVVLEAVEVAWVEPILVLVPGGRMWLRGIRSSSSLAGSWIKALISCTACRVDSVPPLRSRKRT